MTTTTLGSRVAFGMGLLAAVIAAWLSLRYGFGAQILTEAAGIDQESEEGVGGLVNVADAIRGPALVAAGALVPLVLIGGAVMIMIGNRRGMSYIAAAAGAMMLLASVGGLSA